LAEHLFLVLGYLPNHEFVPWVYYRDFEGGRVWYSAAGHFAEAFLVWNMRALGGLVG